MDPVPAVPAAPLPLVLPVVEEVCEPADNEEPAPVPLVDDATVDAPPVVEPVLVVEPVPEEPAVDPVVDPAVDPVAPAPAPAVAFPAAAPAIWNAITPPKGPALLLFAIFIKHTFCCPAAVPEHVVPAGTWTAIGKS